MGRLYSTSTTKRPSETSGCGQEGAGDAVVRANTGKAKEVVFGCDEGGHAGGSSENTLWRPLNGRPKEEDESCNVIHNVKTSMPLVDLTDAFAWANTNVFASCLTVCRPIYLLTDLI